MSSFYTCKAPYPGQLRYNKSKFCYFSSKRAILVKDASGVLYLVLSGGFLHTCNSQATC